MGFDLTGIGSVADAISNIIGKIFPDKNVTEQAKIKLAELAQAGGLKELELLLEQIKVNAVEAASEKWWVAGWRPFIGWICGSALGYTFVIQPFLSFMTGWLVPVLDMGELMTILMGMLGLAGLRTYEKTQNGKK
jgi:hypothetical protein